MFAVDVQHVAKRFGKVEALQDVSLQVPQGAIFGFLGPNGAGKTTTLRGLLGLIRFDAGEARVLGMDPWRERVELHSRLGYMTDGLGMYRRMSGQDVLDYTASLTRGEGMGAPLRGEVLDALGLSVRDLGRPVHDYSKGMRQKLGLVQAMQHDPELLLLDEPSEGLDPLVQREMYSLLRGRAAAGRTIVFSSHTLSEVEALCDQVAIVRRGTLVVETTLDDLRRDRARIVRIAVRDGQQIGALGEGFVREGADHAGRAVYRVTAPPREILAALAHLDLTDVLIEEPSLDDIFRSYYEQEGSA